MVSAARAMNLPSTVEKTWQTGVLMMCNGLHTREQVSQAVYKPGRPGQLGRSGQLEVAIRATGIRAPFAGPSTPPWDRSTASP